ncbi:hypothetical protein EYZ11_003506 [Aspergillus tanneri]|uniref:Uncharacterized protein n=1 Tax=Aspergillus tanneri TaxID=1220188 RepID=A0A4S3JN48_9EURO|nr:hypothetical protein EYZ11_003506 [Aspergillus tanneri]
MATKTRYIQSISPAAKL